MTRELYIEGQLVDLAPDTNITLEYIGNVLGDIGKINLSRSYTVKLPKTARNSAILDSPGIPAHESGSIRRFFDADYYQNGTRIIRDAKAYLIGVSNDRYEIAVIWNQVTGLREWAEAQLKLPDLTNLPTLPWKGASYADTAITDGCFFARYDSGLSYDVNAERWLVPDVGPHPSITLYSLITHIFENAGIPYQIGHIGTMLKGYALLVAPSHKPSLAMELEAGATATGLKWQLSSSSNTYRWWFYNWSAGWDALTAYDYENSQLFQRGPTEEVRFFLNLQITKGDNPDVYLSLEHGGNSYVVSAKKTDDGGYLIDETVDLKGELGVDNDHDYFSVNVKGLTDKGDYSFRPYYSGLPMFAIMRPHETIVASQQNLFPISDNLPNIGQMEFIKGALGLLGGVVMVVDGQVIIEHYDYILNKSKSIDWTYKVDMSEGLIDTKHTLKDFAQLNYIKYEEDAPLVVSPDITIEMQDATATGSKELLKLPFAASNGGNAVHYKEEWHVDEGYWSAEDIEIKPRIFGIYQNSNHESLLRFSDNLGGKSAVKSNLKYYQSLIKKPVVISVNVCLSELDLKAFDPRIAVYLGQYGKYYAVSKIQTSKTDMCKVELIQLP